MSGFEIAKGRGYAADPRRAERPELTPAERAQLAYSRAERTVMEVEATVGALRKAQATNDFGGWQAAQDRLDKEVDRASREIEKARAAQQPAESSSVDPLLDRLAVVTGELGALNVAPSGFTPIAAERELLAAITHKPEGSSIRAGFEAKEAEVRAMLQGLSPQDARNLRARLDKRLPGDELAAAFLTSSNLTEDRQQRLRSVLIRAGKQDPAAVVQREAPSPENRNESAKAATIARAEQRPETAGPTHDHAESTHDHAESTHDHAESTHDHAEPTHDHAEPTHDRAGSSGPAPAHVPKPQTDDRADSSMVTSHGLGFTRGAPPSGLELARTRLDLTALPPEMCGGGNQPIGQLKASGALILASDRIVLAVDVNAQHWFAWIEPAALVASLTHGADVEKLLALDRFVRELPHRVHLSGGRVRISLWGAPPTESFAVLDVSRAVHSLGEGSLDGLRPVEAQILAGKTAGMRVFGNESVKARDAIPGEPIGGWFEISDERLAAALDPDGKQAPSSVWAGVFYDDGLLRVAIKPAEDARTGIAAHVDLISLLDRLSHFGDKAIAWANKVKTKVKDKSARVLDVVAGKMHLALPEISGTWFDFNFSLQLPKLWHGHGFDLSALVPSSFHLDLGGLSIGAMPKVNWAWFASARFASFDVPWDRIAKLLGGLAALPAPKLPKLPFDLHFLGKLSLGVGIDLGVAWPELKDMGLGFELHLETLLAKAQAVGQWLNDKLHGAGDLAHKWLHLGSDGVLRIYDDAHADGPMLGFQLMKLLDGVDASDLAPTELRWKPSGQFGIELGAASDGKPAANAASGPVKPAGTPAMHVTEPVPPELAAMLAIAPGAQADLAVYWKPKAEHVTLWAQAASALQAAPTAVKIDVGYGGIVDAITKRLPAKVQHHLPVAPRLDSGNVVIFAFGDAAREATDTTKSGVSGTIGWKLARLVAAHDLTALEPDVVNLHADGVGDVVLGTINPPGPALGDSFDVEWPAAHEHLFHDAGSQVWVSAHAQGDLVALALTKVKDGKQGAMAQVHVSFLLRQLERLGKLGERALTAIAKAGHVVLDAAGSFADKVARVAEVIGGKLMKIVDGVMQLPLADGQWIHWDLKAQLPRLGVNFDWSRLIPTFHLSFGLGHAGALALSWLPQLDVKGIHLPPIHLPAIRLGKLLDAVPGIDLSRVKGALQFQLGWLPSEMSLDVGIDLSAVVDAFPDVLGGAGRALDFRVPLGKLLDKLEQKAAWAKRKLGKGGDALAAMSLGDDGVLRIHDAADQNVIGFHLTRLLDGVDASDLAPTELRFSPSASFRLEVGEQAGPTGKEAAPADPKAPHKTAPAKPAGKPVLSVTEPAPAMLAELLALKPGSNATMAAYWTPGATNVTLWAEAPSTVYERPEAVKLEIGLAGVIERIAKRLPKAKSAPHLPITLKPTAGGMVTFAFGDAARDPSDKAPPSGVTGRIGWKVAKLMAASDLSALEPELWDTSAEGIGSFVLGTIHPIGEPHGSFEIDWPEGYEHVFHEPGSKLWVGAYAQDSVVGLSLTKTEGGKQGAMATLNLEFLLRQLERLGKLADKILHALAKLAHVTGELTGDVGARAKVIASKLATKLEPITSGLLKFPLDGGQWISWDLKRLPSLGLDFDWSKLVPNFQLSLPAGKLGSISLSWLSALKVEGIHISRVSLPSLHLAHALDFLPGFDVGKLKGLVPFELGWISRTMDLDPMPLT